MTAKHVARVTLALCAALLLLPAIAAAQASTFLVPFERAGTPGTKLVNDPLSTTTPPEQIVVDTGAFENPCTFELVDVFGSSTISTLQTVNKNGSRKINVNVSSRGSGLGWVPLPEPASRGDAGWAEWELLRVSGLAMFNFTGSTYSFMDNQSFTVSLAAGGLPAFFDFQDKMVLAGDGSIDNWVIRATFRLKIAKDGTIVIELLKTNSDKECKG